MNGLDAGYLWDMLDFAREASGMAAGKTREGVKSDRTFQLAALHLIQTIGEAASHVSQAFASANPEIPWRDMIGMRHVIVHGYRDIDLEEIWMVLIRDLPVLIRGLETLLPNERPQG